MHVKKYIYPWIRACLFSAPLCVASCGGSGGGNENAPDNTNLNDNRNSSPCDSGEALVIEGVPDGKVGTGSTLTPTAIVCIDGGPFSFTWTWDGPEDDAILTDTDQAEAVFTIFSEGQYTLAVTAASDQTILSAQFEVTAVIGGPPFGE